MSPEYAMNGVVSIKTDVFSFGVLLLEIVSGKKNNNRHYSDSPLSLIVYVSLKFKLSSLVYGILNLIVNNLCIIGFVTGMEIME